MWLRHHRQGLTACRLPSKGVLRSDPPMYRHDLPALRPAWVPLAGAVWCWYQSGGTDGVTPPDMEAAMPPITDAPDAPDEVAKNIATFAVRRLRTQGVTT